jgi:hypothetical protein
MDYGLLMLLIAVVGVLVPLVVTTVIGVMAYRSLKGPVGRARLSFNSAFMVPGPQKDACRLRLQLSREIRDSKRALAALKANGTTQGELPFLVRRLEVVGHTLDSQLQLLQSESDPEILYEFLRPARARVADLVRAGRRIRHVAVVILGGETDGRLAQLTGDVEREVLALQAGVDALRALTSGDVVDEIQIEAPRTVERSRRG